MKFAKSADGLIHLISAIHSEYTLCGDAWDGESGNSDDAHSWTRWKTGPVTCPNCVAQIRECRGVKIVDDATKKGE